jgi:hypothetical protein
MKRVLLVVAGLAAGLALGLLYSWVISPAQYVNTDPASLRADYRADYVQLVAQSFAADSDVDRARARLALLGEADPARLVTALAQRAAASGGDPESVRPLAALASALGARPASPTPAPASATPEVTPTLELAITAEPTATSIPSETPLSQSASTTGGAIAAPTPPGAFVFVGKQAMCDAKLKQPLIQVLTLGANGSPVPGMEALVEWSNGFDHFFTGLKPELGTGYGDFAMSEGVDYTVRLAADPATAIGGLKVEPCTDAGGKQLLGSWLLVFRQT